MLPENVTPDSHTHSSNRRFCLRHPEIRDVCDIGQYLFWNSKIAWWATAVMFLLNNTFIQVSYFSLRNSFSILRS